ncbi:MAG: filamentous hemagglutinin N-terminal domain-containing protein [Synechococcales bacterium]|nr:filamentous hemagglutinin N-terminal domain-containing protein [Synechococcales bacterium]
MRKSVLFPSHLRRPSLPAPIGLGCLVLAHGALLQGEAAQAQITPDQTLGAERSVIDRNVEIRGALGDRIGGGARRGANLFHSFSEFGVERDQRVYFSNPGGVENILSRVTGSNRSDILGKLGVDGSANLFLINPNGILFGPNAQLDVAGSFVAGTSDRILFSNGESFSARNPQAPPLLEINIPIGLQMGATPPAELRNAANLVAGKDLQLTAGAVTSTGSIAAPQGQVKIEATVGNAEVQQLTAKSATIAAQQNVILNNSQLNTTENLAIVAGNTLKVRDSLTAPVQVNAGGNLTLQGNQQIDILALNHPTTPFQAGGNLSLISDGLISGDAHFSSGGSFSMLNLAGQPGTFVSFFDPIVRSGGNVTFGTYTGTSLKVEAAGSINATGGITITGPDAAIPGSDPDAATLTGGPALILRSGVAVSSPNVPTTQEGTNFTANPAGTANPGNITVNSIDVGDGNAGTLILEARNGGSINFNGASVTTNGGSTSTRGNLNFNNGTVDGNITASELSETFTFNGGAFNGTIAAGDGQDRVIGTANDDSFTITAVNAGTLNTTASFQQIEGFEGRGGTDAIVGTVGDDTMTLTSTNTLTAANISVSEVEQVDTAGGNDTLLGRSEADTFTITGNNAGTIGSFSFQNIEAFQGQDGTDTIAGTAGNDTFTITGANSFTSNSINFSTIERIDGAGGDNTVQGSSGNDTFSLGDSIANGFQITNIQTLDGADGNDSLIGTVNNDTVIISAANAGTMGATNFNNIEIFEGRAGTDTVTGTAANDAFVLTGSNRVESNNISFREIERVDGAGGTNTVQGTAENDTFSLDGTGTGLQITNIQTLDGAGGTNTLQGSNGIDLFNVTNNIQGELTSGVNTIAFSNIQRLEGLGGDDTFQIQPTGQMGQINGSAGINTLSYSPFVTGATINFATASASGVTAFSNINSIVGGAGNDTVIGTNGNDTFTIANNNTEAFTGIRVSGVENLQGQTGNDTFRFNDGAFLPGTLDGGGDSDRLDYSNYTTNITVNLQTNIASGIAGGFNSIESVRGGSGIDTLIGTVGNDTFELDGELSSSAITFSNLEILNANGGFDILRGSSGNDIFTLNGLLFQGSLNGTLSFINVEALEGGQGNDTFNFNSATTVNARGNQGNDTFNLNPGAAVTGSLIGDAGDDTLNLNGGTVTGAFSGGADRDTVVGTLGNDTFNVTGTNSATHVGSSVIFNEVEAIDGSVGIDTVHGRDNVSDTFSVGATIVDGFQILSIEILNGGTGNVQDRLVGTEGNDSITIAGERAGTIGGTDFQEIEAFEGRGGTDTIVGQASNDQFTLTSSNTLRSSEIDFSQVEQVNGAGGTDTVIGTANPDTFTITGNNTGTIGAFSFQNIEAFEGRGGSDTIVGRPINETFTLTATNAFTSANINFSQVEIVDALGGTDTLVGTPDNDLLELTSPNTLQASQIEFRQVEEIDAAAGNDTVIGTAAPNLFTITGNQTGTVHSFAFRDIEAFQGQGSTDRIVGTSLGNPITGGNDSFRLTSANTLESANINFSQVEEIDGASGNDTVIGTNSSETFTIVNNNAGTIGVFSFQNLEAFNAQGGTDRIVGRAIDETFTLTANNALTTAGMNFTQVEEVEALEGRDTIVGTAVNDIFTLNGAGNQTNVIARNVTFSSVEVLDGSGGINNQVIGTSNADTFSLGGNIANGFYITRIQTLDGAAGEDTLVGTGSDDVLTLTGNKAGAIGITQFSNMEIFEGREGVDTIAGTPSNDTFTLTGTNSMTSSEMSFVQVEHINGAGGTQDLLLGTEGDDLIQISTVFDTSSGFRVSNVELLDGRNGNDLFNMSTGTVTEIKGGEGDDRLIISNGTLGSFRGENGNDRLEQSGGIVGTMEGGNGDDHFTISGGTLTMLNGDEGSDEVNQSGGAVTTINAGNGNDRLTISGGNLAILNAGNGNDEINQNGGAIGAVNSGEGDDRLTASAGTITTANTGNGDDVINQSGGTIGTVNAGNGNDRVTLTGGTLTTLNGESGNDEVNLNGGTIATFNGGDGNDGVNLVGGTLTTFNGQNEDDIVQIIGENPTGTIGTINAGAGNLVVRGDRTLKGLPTAVNGISGTGTIFFDSITSGRKIAINHSEENALVVELDALKAVSDSFTEMVIGRSETSEVAIGSLFNEFKDGSFTLFKNPLTIQGQTIRTEGNFEVAGQPLNLIAQNGEINVKHQISSNVSGNAIGGDLNLQGRSVRLNQSSIVSKTTGTGQSSAITITTPQGSIALDQAKIETVSNASGRSGAIKLIAGQNVTLQQASKINSIAVSSGSSGNIEVTAPIVTLIGNAAIPNPSPNPNLANHPNRSEITIRSTAPGVAAGNLKISASQLNLSSSALIVERGQGGLGDTQGNILIQNLPANSLPASNALTANLLASNVPVANLSIEPPTPASTNPAVRNITLKDDSTIAAIGLGPDTFGGNITIEGFALTQALPAAGFNGNDIVSLAEKRGREGVIVLRGGAADGFVRRRPEVGDRRNNLFGSQVSAADADLGRDLDELSSEFVDPNKLVGQECRVQTDQEASTFRITSRGGLPNNPLAPLAADPETGDWVSLAPTPAPPSLQAMIPERVAQSQKLAQSKKLTQSPKNPQKPSGQCFASFTSNLPK